MSVRLNLEPRHAQMHEHCVEVPAGVRDEPRQDIDGHDCPYCLPQPVVSAIDIPSQTVPGS